MRATPCCPPVAGSGWPPLAIVTSPEDSARRASLRKDSVRRACLHATVFAWSLLAVNTEQYQVLERARLLRRLVPLERPPIQTMLLPARGGLVSWHFGAVPSQPEPHTHDPGCSSLTAGAVKARGSLLLSLTMSNHAIHSWNLSFAASFANLGVLRRYKKVLCVLISRALYARTTTSRLQPDHQIKMGTRLMEQRAHASVLMLKKPDLALNDQNP